MGFTGAEQLQVRRRANVKRIFQGDSRWQGHRAELEKVHLQSDLEAGRPGAGVFQDPELPAAARLNQEVAWLLLFVVRGLISARRLPVITKKPKKKKKGRSNNNNNDSEMKERSAKKDRIRQEVHVLRVKRVQVSLN